MGSNTNQGKGRIMIILVLVALITVMATIAEMDGYSGVLWGIITFVVCIGTAAVIPLPILNLVAGGIISYFLLFAHKLKSEA